MEKTSIHVLVTFDGRYAGPFRTMLKSLTVNNADERFHIWLLHSAIPADELNRLAAYCRAQRAAFTPIRVERSLFQNAPSSERYPQEMYYRLLAPLLLPAEVERVLYLDPDILVLNPVRALWEHELQDFAFAAASHSGVTKIMSEFNRVRLGTHHAYFNSGVMLMDLVKARTIVKAEDLFACVREHEAKLLFPDQDVFNYLYGTRTLQLDDVVFNYDVRFYHNYLIREGGVSTMAWICRNTVFLHYCGRKKPWTSKRAGRFSALYRHYMQMAAR